MRAYMVSKKSNLTQKEKIDMIRGYEVGDLLYVLREFEEHPRRFDKEIIKELQNRLYDKGVRCI